VTPNFLRCSLILRSLRSKQKWDEEDFEGEMEEDFDDEEALPTGHGAVAPGKGILLLPHRQLHPHSQPPKAPRPGVDPEPRSALPPPHAAHGHLGGGQDHGDWTYEEQFRQVGPLPVCVFAWSSYFILTCTRTSLLEIQSVALAPSAMMSSPHQLEP